MLSVKRSLDLREVHYRRIYVACHSFSSSSVVVFPSGVNLLHRVTLDATGEGDCTAPVVVHVINAGGRAFLVSAEISRLFPRWKKRDLLGRMVALKKEVYETVVVNPNDHEDLFAEALE